MIRAAAGDTGFLTGLPDSGPAVRGARGRSARVRRGPRPRPPPHRRAPDLRRAPSYGACRHVGRTGPRRPRHLRPHARQDHHRRRHPRAGVGRPRERPRRDPDRRGADQPRPTAADCRRRERRRRPAPHRDRRLHRGRVAAHRRHRRRGPDDRAGLPGPDRVLAGRGAAVGADGRLLVPPRQPRPRQPRRPPRPRMHHRRADPAVRRTVTVCVTGAAAPVTLDGVRVAQWEPIEVPAGAVLAVGQIAGAGHAPTCCSKAGLDAPTYLGTRLDVPARRFGGYTGEANQIGDRLIPETPHRRGHRTGPGRGAARSSGTHGTSPSPRARSRRPHYFTSTTWHGSTTRPGPCRSTPADRCPPGRAPAPVGRAPTAAKPGCTRRTSTTTRTRSAPQRLRRHPDPARPGRAEPRRVRVPVHRGHGAPVEARAARPGDTVRFLPSPTTGPTRLRARIRSRLDLPPIATHRREQRRRPVLAESTAVRDRPRSPTSAAATTTSSSSTGPMDLDLGLRMRVHALTEALRAADPAGHHRHHSGRALPAPALRRRRTSRRPLAGHPQDIEELLPATHDLVGAELARSGCRCRSTTRRSPRPSTGTATVSATTRRGCRRTSSSSAASTAWTASTTCATPCSTPNTWCSGSATSTSAPRWPCPSTRGTGWSPPNTTRRARGRRRTRVGIGGTYLCVYGMESPGGYQLIGRTVPIWSGYRQHRPFDEGTAVAVAVLRPHRLGTRHPGANCANTATRLAAGRLDADIRDGTFASPTTSGSWPTTPIDIAEFEARQAAAFEAEAAAWRAAGEFDRVDRSRHPSRRPGPSTCRPVAILVEAPMVGSVWRVEVAAGQRVERGAERGGPRGDETRDARARPRPGQCRECSSHRATVVDPGTTLVVSESEQKTWTTVQGMP